MSSPEQRRKILEALHAQSPTGRTFLNLRSALGDVVDKKSVIRIASDFLNCNPVEVDGKIRIGKFEFDFDANDNLRSLGTWTGGIVIAERFT